MRARAVDIQTAPPIQELTHATFARFVGDHDVAIVLCHGPYDRGFSAKLAAYFKNEIGSAAGFGSLAWPAGIGAPWFGRHLSEETSRATQKWLSFQDGYYLFRQGVGIAHAALCDLDQGKEVGGHLVAAVLSYALDSSKPSQIWQTTMSDAGIEPTIWYFDAVLARAHQQEQEERKQHEEERRQRRERAGQQSRPQAPPTASAPQRDPYELLGVTRQATNKEIKSKFRELQRTNHPDRVADMDATIQEFTNARLRDIIDAYDKIKRERGFR